MKKIFAVIACLAVALSMSACTSGGESSTAPAGNTSSTASVASSSSASVAPASSAAEESSTAPESSEAPAAQDSGAIGDYTVSILDASLTKDYEDNDAIVISYEFTNNSDEAISFMVAIGAKAYQDGVELETAIITGDDNYSSEDLMKEIKPGATLTVQKAFALDNTTSPVEAEAEELFSWEDDAPVLTRTFDLAALQ